MRERDHHAKAKAKEECQRRVFAINTTTSVE